MKKGLKEDSTGEEVCNFCGKMSKDVTLMIAGTSAHICNECISVCNNIIEDYEIKEK